MAGEDGPGILVAQRHVIAAPSLACDLSWVLSVAALPAWRPRFPLISQMLSGREDLIDRTRSFWDGELSPETFFTELLVLSHHAGALTEPSPDALWPALERAVATVPTDLPLQSEKPEERLVFLARLEALKGSTSLRHAYIDLLRQMWEPFDEIWQPTLPALADSATTLAAQIVRGRPLADVLPMGCETFSLMLDDITQRIDGGQPLQVVPCFFFGKSLYLEFPGLTLIGVGNASGDLGARARTAAVARRIKTVADPTRLAILHYLITTPSTVGDLASSFGLAQPTVSMHVKVLRETGLVGAERKEGRLQLRADPEAVHALLRDLHDAVTPSAAKQAAWPVAG